MGTRMMLGSCSDVASASASIASSMACRVINSWALVVNAIASSSKSVDSALASSARMRSSIGSRSEDVSPCTGLELVEVAPNEPGGGIRHSSRGRSMTARASISASRASARSNPSPPTQRRIQPGLASAAGRSSASTWEIHSESRWLLVAEHHRWRRPGPSAWP